MLLLAPDRIWTLDQACKATGLGQENFARFRKLGMLGRPAGESGRGYSTEQVWRAAILKAEAMNNVRQEYFARELTDVTYRNPKFSHRDLADPYLIGCYFHSEHAPLLLVVKIDEVAQAVRNSIVSDNATPIGEAWNRVAFHNLTDILASVDAKLIDIDASEEN